MPAPAMSTSAQGERRLVLDVLDANALRPAEEHRVGIGRVDDVVDLDAEVVRGRERLVGRVDEHGEMVQQGLLRHAGISGVELDPGAADAYPGRAPRARICGLEAERAVLDRRLLRIRGEERDVV